MSRCLSLLPSISWKISQARLYFPHLRASWRYKIASVQGRAAETCGLHGLVRLEPKLMGAIKSGRNWLNSKMCKFRELPSAKIRIIQCRIVLCFCWVVTVIRKINKYINVTPLAHSSNEITWSNIDFFLEISCSGSNVSLHWYHRGSIVYPALTADPALTPYYPTADTDMPLQNLENQEISGKKTGDLTKNQEIVSNKFCSLSHFKLCIFSIIFNT